MSKVEIKSISHPLKLIIVFSDYSLKADLSQGVSYVFEE
jgi:hypothetical protein